MTEWPQPTIASGADVITRFIIDIADDAAGDRDDEERLRARSPTAGGPDRARSSRGTGGGDLERISTRPASAASTDCAMKVAANRCGGHQSLVTITTAGR